MQGRPRTQAGGTDRAAPSSAALFDDFDVIAGLGLVIWIQAVEQFELWTGVDAPEDLMRQVAAMAIKSRSEK